LKIQDRRQIKNTANAETEHKVEKANNAKKTQQVKTVLVQSPLYDTRPGNKVGLFYNAPAPTWGNKCLGVMLVSYIVPKTRKNQRQYIKNSYIR